VTRTADGSGLEQARASPSAAARNDRICGPI
jgi:hypothetical protein